MSDTFLDFCRSLGLKVSTVVPDGKWHRCPTEAKPRGKRGAWKLAIDGRIGWAWDPGLHSGAHTWKPEGTEQPDDFDPERLQAARDAAREQRRRMIDATRDAREFWDQCAPLRNSHPYLDAKGLDMQGAAGLRVDSDGWLVVPAYRNGSLSSYQRISPDGQKLFAPGAAMRGAAFTIERPSAALHVVCEGLATGMAIFAAVPMSRVVVAFTAGGLAAAAESLPPGLAVIAADNDHRTVCQKHRTEGLESPYTPWEERPEWCTCNPGRVAATEAASVSGAGVALPDCPDGGTDWNDWRQQTLRGRLESWTRRGHETEQSIRRAVDAHIAMQIQRAARFRAPKMEDVK